MDSKKNLIIKAFEQLDAGMLDVLLNDDQPYQDVPKELFVSELRTYFSEMISGRHSKLDYKAYKGACQNCSKGKAGYSFINSEGHSFMSMVFEESENDFTDIYRCANFCTEDIEIDEEMDGIFFYKDDEVFYIPTAKNILDEKRCNDAYSELQREIETEGILSKKFYIPWAEKYGDIDDVSQVFTGETYRYQLKIKPELSTLKFISGNIPLEDTARKYWAEFIQLPIINRETIQDWLIRCDQDLEFLKYGFADNANFLLGYFENRKLKIDLRELYYYHNISAILNKYFDWIPDSDSIGDEQNLEDD